MRLLGCAVLAIAVAMTSGCRYGHRRASDDAPADAARAITAPTSPAAPVVDREEIRIRYQPAAVGDRWTAVEETTVAATAAGAAEARTTRLEWRLEVLAVEGDAVTKAKVTHVATSGGDAARAPLQGKPVVLTRAGRELRITQEDGRALPELEALGARADLLARGLRDPLERVLAARVWQLGRPVELTADELRALGENPGAPSTRALSLRLKALDGEVLTLRVERELTFGAGADALGARLVGTLRVDIARGRLLEERVAGPLREGATELGTLTLRRVYTY